MGTCCSNSQEYTPAGNQPLAARKASHSSEDNDQTRLMLPELQVVASSNDPTPKENVYEAWKNATEASDILLMGTLIQDHRDLDLLEYTFQNGDHPLHIAVSKNNKQLSLFLLSNGVRVNVQNNDGDTPLHCAVRTQDLKIITLLLKNGADATSKNKKGETAQDIARSLHSQDIDDLFELNHVDEPNGKITNLDDNKTQNDNEKSGPSPNLAQQDTNENNVISQPLQSNPSRGKLIKHATKKILEDIENITQEKKKLPVLQGWLEKKMSRAPYSWQKRWVILKDAHLLWSDKQYSIDDPSKPEERKLFNGSMNVMMIHEIQILDTKSGKKFVIVARDGKKGGQRQYEWKASSKTDRDYWVSGLNAHKDHFQSIVNILNN